MLFIPWNQSVGPETPLPNVAVLNHSFPSWEWSGSGPVASPLVWLTSRGDRNVQRTLPLATLKAIVVSNAVVAKAVPLTMIIDIPTPTPLNPLTSELSEVGAVGIGKIQAKPKYWTLELLIWVWGL